MQNHHLENVGIFQILYILLVYFYGPFFDCYVQLCEQPKGNIPKQLDR